MPLPAAVTTFDACRVETPPWAAFLALAKQAYREAVGCLSTFAQKSRRRAGFLFSLLVRAYHMITR
jgi:hypothetical protein